MRNVIGQPVKGKDFFERPKVIKKIQKALGAKNHILVSAPRRAGKTSLLFHLRDVPIENYNFIYFNAEPIFKEYEFYERLIDVLRSTNEISIRSDSFDKRGLPQEHTKLRVMKEEMIEELNSSRIEYPLVIMVDNFSMAVENIFKKVGAEAAIGFLKENREFRDQLNTGFRTIRFIYTAADDFETLTNKLNASQNINDLFPIAVPPFSDKEVETFIHTLTKKTDFELDSAQIRYFCQKLLWFNPFHIQLLFFELDSIYLEKELAEITNLAIDEAFERMLKHKDYIESGQRQSPILTSSKEDQKVRKGFKKIKIQRIRIQHIKCFEHVEITFDSSVNTGLIIGTNGKGKSTILQLIALGLGGIKDVPFPQNWKEVVRKNNTKGFFEIDVLFDNKPIQFKFEIDNSNDSITCTQGSDQLKEIQDTFMLLAYGANRSIRREDIKQFKDNIPPFATLFGENGYLKHIKDSPTHENVKKHFNTIQALINKVLETANGGENVILESYDANGFYFKTPSNPEYLIPTEALSEGFKSTFVWVFDAIIRIVEKGESLENAADVTGIILLDEVDLHLHPTWQRTILQSIETLFPNIQFIATTHSPFVVQSAQKDCLIALEMEKGSNSVVVVGKKITSELSYSAIVREIFNIRFPFNREIERKMDEFREMQYAIRDKKEIDEKKFVELVLDIASEGVELEGIMRRELRSLEYRTGKTFGLWKE